MNEIRANYKALHNDLERDYYGGTSELTKEEFDFQHGKIWNDMETELIAEGYLIPPEPIRDLIAEIDELKAEIENLKVIK